MTVAGRCMQTEPVLDRKGQQVVVETPDGGTALAYEFNSAGANRALELLGKEVGMFIERKEQGLPGDFSKSVDELKASIQERVVKLGLGRAQLKVVPDNDKKAVSGKITGRIEELRKPVVEAPVQAE